MDKVSSINATFFLQMQIQIGGQSQFQHVRVLL